MEVQPLLRALGRHCPPSSALPRVPRAATSSLFPRSLGADPFSPQHLSLGGSGGSSMGDPNLICGAGGTCGPARGGCKSFSCGRSATTCPENSSLRLGNLFLQLPTASFPSAPSTTTAGAGLGAQQAPGELCPWLWGQFPLLLPARPSPCSQNSARMILPFSMPPPGRGKCQPRATKTSQGGGKWGARTSCQFCTDPVQHPEEALGAPARVSCCTRGGGTWNNAGPPVTDLLLLFITPQLSSGAQIRL